MSIVDNAGNNYWVKEQADLVNGYGNIKQWKKSYQNWNEEPNTIGYSQSTNWMPYRVEGQRASDDARSFESSVGGTLIIGTLGFLADWD